MDEHPPQEIDPRRYARVLKRQAWLVALIVAIGVGAAYAVVRLETPRYRANSTIVVGQGSGLFQAQFAGGAETFTQTIITLLKSDIVARRAIALGHFGITPEQLLSHLHISTKPGSSALDVSYETTRRSEAVPILSAIDSAFARLASEKLTLPRSAGGGTASSQAITATVFDPAHLRPGQVWPQPVRTLVLAGLLALLVGLLLAFFRDSLDSRLRTRTDAQEWFGAPVVGTLPRGLRRHALSIKSESHGKDGRMLDAIHLLRANLEFSDSLRGPTLLVTSAVSEEGKSTVVASLGLALAMAGRAVICVEADLRRPRLLSYLGLPENGPGLVEMLLDSAELNETLLQVPLPRQQRKVPQPAGSGDGKPGKLGIIGAGNLADLDASEVLTVEHLIPIVKDLQARADYVLFDSPPILPVGDAFSLARLADGVVVVARRGHTSSQSAQAVRATLRGLGVKTYGVVLTDWGAAAGQGYGYGRQYRSERARR